MAQKFKRDSIGRSSGGGTALRSGGAKAKPKGKPAKRKGSNSGSIAMNPKASKALAKKR